MEEKNQVEELRRQIADINRELLELLNRRAALVMNMQQLKSQFGLPTFDPEREKAMYAALLAENHGPFSNDTIKALFKEIFKASLDLMYQTKKEGLIISKKEPDIKPVSCPRLIAGPCAIEDEQQMETVAAALSAQGVKYIRGGAFKPRTSPYSFQGLGFDGLKMMRTIADRHHLKIVSEIMTPRQLENAGPLIDIIQIGARNMYNYDLLKELGHCQKPILLKRGLSATIEEFMLAAEYIAQEGNNQIILCERGIRTFERATRNTLDISAVPLLKNQTSLPVMVDISHAAGRKDLLQPLAKAALAAGADGLMLEVHPWPAGALSDAQQQLDLTEFTAWCNAVFPEGLL